MPYLEGSGFLGFGEVILGTDPIEERVEGEKEEGRSIDVRFKRGQDLFHIIVATYLEQLWLL